METLIILKGKASIGKSGTLNQLIELLLDSPDSRLLEPSDIQSAIDNFAIVKYAGRNVGIITFGDPGCEDAVQNRLETCSKFNCDLIVGASRTYGGVNNILWEHAAKNSARVYQTEPIYGYSTPNRIDFKQLNKIAAENLRRLIDHLLSENSK